MTKPGVVVATPGVRPPTTAAMLFLSVCGMAIGLAVDCGVTPPALLAALCADSSGSLAATLRFHVAVMPASYAMTGVAAVLAMAFNQAKAGQRRWTASRLAATATSAIVMVVGMFAGGWLAPDAAALLGAEPGFGPLVIGMVAGMMAATLVAGAIARVLDTATAPPKPKPAQYIMYQ